MGEFVDSTLGVTFGLSTLAAAGIGQIFSDVSGVCFGGTVEAFMGRLGIPTASISSEQAKTAILCVDFPNDDCMCTGQDANYKTCLNIWSSMWVRRSLGLPRPFMTLSFQFRL